jgi:DNA-binding CsgD family transcriptional regulator
MAEWPFTGRTEELSEIANAVRHNGIVLAGKAGVGKTRLAREALAAARDRGRVGHWVTATASARQLPLGAFALLVGDVGGDPTKLLQRAADALLAAGGDGRPMVVVDDAHLLDDLSAALVLQFVVHSGATVVLTVRTGHSVPPAVESVWKDGYLDRHEVTALAPAQSAALLAARLAGPVEPDSARRLHELSDGNVLFLRHVVEGELAAGHLVDRADGWRWDGDLAVSIELADLVGRNLSGQTGPTADLLDLLALGGPLDLRAITRLVPYEVVEDAEAADLVRVRGAADRPVVALAHPLYGEVRLARMGELRARRLRGTIVAGLVAAADHTPTDLLRLGMLSLESDRPRDPDLLTRAAEAALRLFDWQLSERLAAAAAAAGGGFAANLVLSYALAFGLDPLAADQILDVLVRQADGDLQLLQASLPRSGHLYFMRGLVPEAVDLLERTREQLVDPALRPVVDGMLGMFAAMAGDADHGLDLAELALALPEAPEQLAVCARLARATALAAVGRTAQIGAADADVYRTAMTSYDSSLPSMGYCEEHVRALCLAGRLDEATRLADSIRPEIRDPTGKFTLIADAVGCLTDLARGRVRSAREVAVRCIDGLRGRDTSGWLYTTTITLTNATAMLGDAPAAKAAAEHMDAERHPAFAVLEAERLLARSWVEAAEGATTAAVDTARSAARLAAAQGHWGHEANALANAVRFGDPSAHHRLRELSELVDGPRTRAAAHQARALATADPGTALEAATLFEQLGDLLAAADAAAQAAILFAGTGDRAAHLAAATRARRLSTACQNARTPALAAALHPLPLTHREREIVTLAAAGLTNREIATRLTISVRTVEGHLYRATAKLGTPTRHHLPALLDPER